MADLLSLRLLSAVLLVVTADPAPGRVPKVYNALITSNQNLEPSKAYPVYQPVVHDAVFSYQPSFVYGGHFPLGNGIIPIPANPSNQEPSLDSEPAAPAPESPPTEAPPTEPTSPEPAPEEPQPETDSTTTAPPLPPKTESPIPLNEFGLPSQILPLGRIDPAYNGYNQLGPFAYSYPSYPSYSPYPGVRLYDPFDPFNLGPYSFPLYRPLPSVLRGGLPLVPARPASAPVPPLSNKSTPPPEPSDLNVLNYSAKDPAIPNVPPPPLPKGGLKSDKSE